MKLRLKRDIAALETGSQHLSLFRYVFGLNWLIHFEEVIRSLSIGEIFGFEAH
jgi:hypothetical protein